MKKILLPLSLISVLSLAQQNTGINTTNPQATLEVASKTENTTNEVEGLLIPRVSKQKALLMAQNTAAPLVESTLIYINNLADFVDPADGTETTVAAITENGYYHWNDSQWVKVVGKEGALWKKNSEGDVYLKNENTSSNYVEYKANGGYESKSKQDYLVNSSISFNKTTGQYEPTVQNDNLSYSYNRFSQQSHNLISPSTFTGTIKSFNDFNLTIDKSDNFTGNTYYVNSFSSTISAENSNDYNSLLLFRNGVSHTGSGTINNVRHSYNTIDIASNSVSLNTQLQYNMLQNYSSTATNTNNLIINRYRPRGTGNVNEIALVRNWGDFTYNSSSDIDTYISTEDRLEINDNYTGTIDKLMGYRQIFKRVNGGSIPNVNEAYGMYIGSVDWGANRNYSIFTGEGNIRFGDLKGTGERVVIADADGVLSTSTQSLANLSSKWVEESDKVVLDQNLVSENIEYLKNGGFRQTPRNLRNISRYDATSNSIVTESFDIDNMQKYNKVHNFKTIYSDNLAIDTESNIKRMEENLLIVDENETSNASQIRNINNSLIINGNDTNNHNVINNVLNAVTNYGTGNLSYLTGQYGSVETYRGNINYLRGSFNGAMTKGTATVTNMIANWNSLSPRGSGLVNNAYGNFNHMILRNSGNIDKLYGDYSQNRFETSFTGIIDTYANYITENLVLSGANPRINNMYGIKLDDVNLGSVLNYAIYTGKGLNRFGDKIKLDMGDDNNYSIINSALSSGLGLSFRAISSTNSNSRPANYIDFDFENPVDSDQQAIIRYFRSTDLNAEKSILIYKGNNTTNLVSKFAVGNHSFISNESGFNFGVGTTTPTEKLEVAGKVKADSFISTVAGANQFPDYVFQNYYNGESNLNADYEFKSLIEVENFIKENGHLPGYVSAEEVEKAGQFDMTATQLTNVEKIEELYLHSIEQEKKIQAQEDKLEQQASEIAQLKALVNQLINK